MMSTSLHLLWAVMLQLVSAEQKRHPPHIVLVVADDLGWNDVSWHNEKMYSPQLESLAREGVILEQHYVLPTCTPTRAALLTGRYPYKLGVQGHGFRHLEPNGLPLGVKTLAEELKRRNYSTHAFGKWHLGYCNWSLTPTRRGFDTFRGYYLGSQDYFNHTLKERKASPRKGRKTIEDLNRVPHPAGYDYRNNENVDLRVKGNYSTTLIMKHVLKTIKEKSKENRPVFFYVAFQAVHAPLQVPSGYRNVCSNHTNDNRVKICEMLATMDYSIGRIVKKLRDVGMWNNTLFVFMSDNGGQVLYGGNNWPLRGNKNTLFEGGTRVPAFVAGPLLKTKGKNSSSIMHVVDWLPTLLSASGQSKKAPMKGIDGVDQWPMIRDGQDAGPRKQFVYNLDCKDGKLLGAIRDKDLKLILRPPKKFSGRYLECQEEFDNVELVDSELEWVLYNITDDPYEERNLVWKLSTEARHLYAKLYKQIRTLVPSRSFKDDVKGVPRTYKGENVFSPGWCIAPVWNPIKQTLAGRCC